MLRQLFETVSPFFDERLVVKFLRDNDVDHSEGERVVGARPHLEPYRGLVGDLRAARINNDIFGLFVPD